MTTTVTDEQIRQLAETAKPSVWLFCGGVRNGTWTAPKRSNWNTNVDRLSCGDRRDERRSARLAARRQRRGWP